MLDALESIVQSLESELYAGLQQQALLRIATRDADDWPVLAFAITIGCPVCTEDADFLVLALPLGQQIGLSCI